MSSPPAFIYSEAVVAETLGISRTEARSYRASLIENEHWKKERGEILLSNKGLERFSELCAHAPLGFLESLTGKKNGGPKKMRVAQITENQKMVTAQTDDSPAYHLVHVGNNATFVVGDEIEVGPHTTQKGIWQLLSALPRDRRRLPGQ